MAGDIKAEPSVLLAGRVPMPYRQAFLAYCDERNLSIAAGLKVAIESLVGIPIEERNAEME